MTAQERAKFPLFGVLLFLAIAVGCGLSYYYTRERHPDSGAPTTGGAVVSGPAVTAPISNAPPPPATTPAATTITLGDAQSMPPHADGETGTAQPPVHEDTAKDSDRAGGTPAQTADAHTDGPSVPKENTYASAGEGSAARQPTSDGPGSSPTLGTEHAGSAEPVPQSAGDRGGAPGVVLYGKGRPVTPEGGVVRGDIPLGQEKRGARMDPAGQDSIVGLALVQDLARFLAENYWPAGTHPMAGEHGISTAGVKWANTRYGGQLRGFEAGSDDSAQTRKRVLNYVLMPSMVRALYGLYDDRFYESLQSEAAAQKRGPGKSPLAPAQMAEMFGIYSGMAANLAGAVRAYVHTPHLRPLVAAYAQASQETAAAYAAYTESRDHANAIRQSETAQAYQNALKHREQAKSTLASAMRRGGAGQGLDADSLVYTAQWLYRRGDQSAPALSALAEILDDCALRLSALAREYRGLPVGARRR